MGFVNEFLKVDLNYSIFQAKTLFLSYNPICLAASCFGKSSSLQVTPQRWNAPLNKELSMRRSEATEAISWRRRDCHAAKERRLAVTVS
jgi:hypothetical protein